MDTTSIQDAAWVDLPALDAALRAQLGDAFLGVSHQRETVLVHHAPRADPLLIRSVVVNHLKDAPELLAAKAAARRDLRDAQDRARALLADDAAWAAATDSEKFDALRADALRRR